MTLQFLSLIKQAEGIVFDGVFTFFYDFTTIQTFPSSKIDEMIKK